MRVGNHAVRACGAGAVLLPRARGGRLAGDESAVRETWAGPCASHAAIAAAPDWLRIS